jgi:hypothetical protein
MIAENGHLDHPRTELRRPKCDTPVPLEGVQVDGHLSESTAHALIDHLLLIETELAEIRRLVLEEVLP